MVNEMLRRYGPAAGLAAAIGLVVAAGPARAAPVAEIEFGALTPSPGGCSHASGDEGLVCANSQVFTANGSTFTATGYSDAFTTPSALTLKPLSPLSPANSLEESGLGENASGPNSACTDTSDPHDCEIGPGTSVTVTSENPITDVVLGSVQAGETADIYINNGTGLSLFTTVTGGTGSCTEFDGNAATCVVTGFSADEIGVLGLTNSGGSGSSDTTIVAVSQPAAPVPEPASLALLGTALTGLGLGLARRRRGSAAAP